MTNHDPRNAGQPGRADRPRRPPRIVVLAAIVVVAALTVGVVGLLRGTPAPDSDSDPAAARTLPVQASLPARDPSCPAGGIDRLAELLFDWDTATSSRQDLIRRIAGTADPSGMETPGLLADLDGYLPSEDAWTILAGYRTRQALTVIRHRMPRGWLKIVAADRARLPAGVGAFTLDGARHRTGTVGGAQSAFTDRVSFTMFVTCPPGRGGWRLLRLSRLGDPLP